MRSLLAMWWKLSEMSKLAYICSLYWIWVLLNLHSTNATPNQYPIQVLYSLPVHSFNALIIPILRGCLQSLFNIPVPWYRFDTVLKVISWPAFVSRCIIDAYFSFYGFVLDIDMNCGCRLYRSFWQMDFTYAMDCLLNSITGMNVAFLLTVSPPTHNYDYHKQIKNNFNSPQVTFRVFCTDS